MENIFKKQYTTDDILKVKLSIFELDLIRESLIHSVKTGDWDLEYDAEAQTLIKMINNKLSKFKLDGDN
tara:strand:+ start:563 stop:769 length:207 start_codon:yes stop_codon:yes gene_type:complete